MAITARIPDDESAVPKVLADLRRDVRELGPSVAATLLPVVRAATITAESALAASADALNEAGVGLERAVERWRGASFRDAA